MDTKFEFVVVDYKSLWGDGEGHSIEEWKKILQDKDVKFDKIVGIKRND